MIVIQDQAIIIAIKSSTKRKVQNLNKENNEKERRDKERIERDKERNLKDFKENIPAPGQYSISENTITPSYSFPKSKTTSKSRSNERDNDRFYDVEGSYKKTQEKHFQSTIGKSKRKEDNVESKLGPGYYNLYDPNGTQKGITISERFNEKEKESTPGPGAYKPQWDSVDIIYTNDIKFGTSQKMSDDKQNDYPGPGFYKIEGKLDKGAKIGTSQRSKFEAVDTPAPNYYKIPSNMCCKKCGERPNPNKIWR